MHDPSNPEINRHGAHVTSLFTGKPSLTILTIVEVLTKTTATGQNKSVKTVNQGVAPSSYLGKHICREYLQ